MLRTSTADMTREIVRVRSDGQFQFWIKAQGDLVIGSERIQVLKMWFDYRWRLGSRLTH